jgi:stearoyl-CoA desaturase (Delta-9 desaturase)
VGYPDKIFVTKNPNVNFFNIKIMSFINEMLQQPSYGWQDENGELIKPSLQQLFKEAFCRVNIFADRKNWIPFMSWSMAVCMFPFFLLFILHYFSLRLLISFLLYSVIIMSTHSTIWLHRFCSHKAYTFSHPFWRFLTQNLVIKTYPEELYVLPHHVHHVNSDMPGDPYNAKAGITYCMLADVNHATMAKNLTIQQYNKVVNFISHTGVFINSYSEYKKWGSISSPFFITILWLANWAFWYCIFYLIDGHGLACAMFGAAMFWMILVRMFNYTGHGKGEIKHRVGIDYDHRNLSINQIRPGLFSGEWHNNHHLYPASARSGFLPYQVDLAWVYIYSMYKIGIVSSYHDSKKQFLRKYKDENKIQQNNGNYI